MFSDVLFPPVVDQCHSEYLQGGNIIVIIHHFLDIVQGVDSVGKPSVHWSKNVEPECICTMDVRK